MKVELQRDPNLNRWNHRDSVHITRCLPFYKTARGQYIHRVRFAAHYNGNFYTESGWVRRYSHTAFSAWCGNTGFHAESYKSNVTLLEVPPERAVHCAICEAKAVGAGFAEAHEICGRFVMFRPRV